MFNEIGVDNRVEEVIVNGVVDMCVLVIVAPVQTQYSERPGAWSTVLRAYQRVR